MGEVEAGEGGGGMFDWPVTRCRDDSFRGGFMNHLHLAFPFDL